MRHAILAAILICAPFGAEAAAERELALGGGVFLPYTDAGFVTVEYTATAFGLAIRPEVVTRSDGAEPVVRPVTEADLDAACAAVLATPDARLGGRLPQYVFFQTVTRRVDLGLIDFDKTEQVFFEIRRGACKRLKRAPEGTK